MAETKNKLKVTYTRSVIGRHFTQQRVLESLGLHKISDTNILPDNEAIRGMIFAVKHLVSVEEVKGE